MTQAQFVADLGNDVVFFAWAGSVAFLAVYLLLARGWRTEIGRALIALDGGLTLSLGPSVVHRLTGLSLTSLGFAWYFTGSIAVVGAATWWRTWFVVKVQARGIGLTPRQFGWHLLRGTWNAVAGIPRRLRKPAAVPETGREEALCSPLSPPSCSLSPGSSTGPGRTCLSGSTLRGWPSPGWCAWR